MRRRPWFFKADRTGAGGVREWWAYFGTYGDDIFDDEFDWGDPASQTTTSVGVDMMNFS